MNINMDYVMLLSQDQDLFISSILLILSSVFVIIFYFNRHHFGIGSNNEQVKSKGIPRNNQREEYFTARDSMDLTNEEQLEKLKTLLMKRAIQTIPSILILSDEGEAIEKLYKRGMLTDSMHIEVNEMKLFVDKEYNDVRAEADKLMADWGKYIWPQAKEYYTMIQMNTEELKEEKKAEEEKKKLLLKRKERKERLKNDTTGFESKPRRNSKEQENNSGDILEIPSQIRKDKNNNIN